MNLPLSSVIFFLLIFLALSALFEVSIGTLIRYRSALLFLIAIASMKELRDKHGHESGKPMQIRDYN